MARNPEKIQAITSWPQLRSLTDLRAFLGLTGFYKKIVQHYATLASSLTDLLQHKQFTWTLETQQASKILQSQMEKIPTLRLLEFQQPFTVETNAFVVVVGVVLSQANHPIAFFSKKMCPRLQSASV